MKHNYTIGYQTLTIIIGLISITSQVFAKTSQPIPKKLQNSSVIKKSCDINVVSKMNKVSFVARLDRKALLFKVFCDLGAYNKAEIFYVVKHNNGKPILQHFFEYSANGKRSRVTRLVNAHYDKKRKILSSYHKYMGAGLCGHSGKYKWIGTGFKLRTFSLQNNCKPRKNGNHWPVIYPKKR